MALLTGERRVADVVALTDVVAVEIAKDALEPVLRDCPELAAAISSKVGERRGTLDSQRTDGRGDEQRTVLSRIRAYFGLD
jgi:CRP-like cAMP-binding protein